MTTRHEELQIAANKFHTKHPEVWVLFTKFAFELIGKGFKHYSAKGIFERIRWEIDLPAYVKGKEFKLNNNYSSFYARAFMHMHPVYNGFFRTRTQISKSAPAIRRPALGPEHFDHSTAAGIQGG